MFGWFRRKESSAVAVAVATIAAQRAGLLDNDDAWMVDDIRRIDPQKATDAELETAIESCQFYWAHAYPEHEDDLVTWVWGAATDELERRRKTVGADW